MARDYHYPGAELRVFSEAKRWKHYLAGALRPYIRGAVLEVGAGLSETTPYLVNPDVSQWLCLEPDSALFNATAQQLAARNLPVTAIARQGTIDDLQATELFDTILYIDVLEHIEDDAAEMQKAAAHLRHGGNIIVLSPAYQWLYSPFDKAIGHYRRYNKKTLRSAAPVGLEERSMFYLESAGLFLLAMNRFIFRKKYPSRKTVQFWDRLLIPVSKLADKILLHSTGKTIIGIWQKQKP